MTTDDEPKDKI